jgi:cytidylate kinase
MERTISTITVSRQAGSRGDELADLVARQLGWRRAGRELINQAAMAAGVPQVALAQIDELGILRLRPSVREWRAYQVQVERIIRELADQGAVVIVGRGGQMALRGRPDVLHVRVVAPFVVRLAWLQQERNLSEEAARAWLEASAKARTCYVRRSYGVDSNDPALYHLVINTALVELHLAADLVVQCLRSQGIE